jgi:hypothetical protein
MNEWLHRGGGDCGLGIYVGGCLIDEEVGT